ncbi:hypothetical protein BDY17DRAFT_297414 [Neohortaea acidophila]|uniref:G-patch domain-containing protein n=1 Tax=Neohortaea acidophila TaxID=245834 RepID=A0A6A6PUI2_9PEZI|nr:uncharacterized protein BDY17DRAFT_297414 [Neohortaea acidophila]KAF2483426.1 hypothetical protein BDY17DRAFT_297414 [Neohortaea acidophila]
MDASAYLKRHGWRGDGHSLDHTNRGIKKPLLVSQKVDVLGLGKDKHGPVSDQWWLRAFDQGLKNFGTGQQSVLASVQQHGINRGGLYGRFVQGERFEGSIGHSAESSGISTPKERQDTPRDMAIDIPPRDELTAVPESMEKLNRKRKRTERPVEKRARRKLEPDENAVQMAEEERAEANEQVTLPQEKAKKERPLRDIDGQAKQFVVEALRRGLIPAGPGDVRHGMVLTGANATAMRTEPLPAGMQEVFDQVGLHTPMTLPGGSGSNALKKQKIAREKMKRELKRAAKAYLMGDRPQQPKEERNKPKKPRKSRKESEIAQTDAERQAEKHERAAKKEERRQKKATEKAWKASLAAQAASTNAVVANGDAEDRSEGFVIDTEGDENLTNPHTQAKVPSANSRPLAGLEPAGDESYIYIPGRPVPLDPRIWEGKVVKDLPKAVRKARRDWMAAKREAKKVRAGRALPAAPKVSRGQRKIEEREALAKQILLHSRRETQGAGDGSGMVALGGVQDVPLVKVQSTLGGFSKEEVALARAVARRVLKNVKREERAKKVSKDKGKGYKKRKQA